MTINFKNNTIEMTKTESKSASKFGSEAYRQLQEARRDYPTYTVVIKTTSKKSNEFKGFTYEYMEDYISKHDDDAHSIMKEYNERRCKSDEAKEALATSKTYKEMREWFLEKYPAVAAYHKKSGNVKAA